MEQAAFPGERQRNLPSPFGCFLTGKEGVVNSSFLCLQVKCLKLFENEEEEVLE